MVLLMVFPGLNSVFAFGKSSCVSAADSLSKDDTLIIDFKRGILSNKPVFWGDTRFSDIKKMYGKTKRKNSDRFIFSPDDGFFTVISSLEYPELGIKFTFHSGNSIKGQRSFFQNHKVNQVVISNNCRIKSIEGVRFGSTFLEITSKLNLTNVQYLKNGGRRLAEFCTHYISSGGMKIRVSFIGRYAEKESFVLNENIVIGFYP